MGVELNEGVFHLHLVSDATGETLISVGRAAAAQYAALSPIEHVYPLVRNDRQLDRVISEIESAPGIVLYTLIDHELSQRLEASCKEFGIPCLSVLGPVLQLFRSYLGMELTLRVGAQHTLNTEYFKRIDALNYTMMHDDGQLHDDIEGADVVLLGISRTSKTPTSIYMANRGIKTANIPLVPGIPVPPSVFILENPLVVCLIASPERIVQIRQNRILDLGAKIDDTSYVDRAAVSQEIAETRKLCERNKWKLIDVTRRSIEEVAAEIMAQLKIHRQQGLGK